MPLTPSQLLQSQATDFLPVLSTEDSPLHQENQVILTSSVLIKLLPLPKDSMSTPVILNQL